MWPQIDVPSFYLSLENHVNKKMTGPYHAIASLSDVLPIHETLRNTVHVNKLEFMKRMSAFLTQLGKKCTHSFHEFQLVDMNCVSQSFMNR